MSGDEHAQAAERGDLKGTTYEFFVLGMSILSIVNLALVFAFEFESQSWLLVTWTARSPSSSSSTSDTA